MEQNLSLSNRDSLAQSFQTVVNDQDTPDIDPSTLNNSIASMITTYGDTEAMKSTLATWCNKRGESIQDVTDFLDAVDEWLEDIKQEPNPYIVPVPSAIINFVPKFAFVDEGGMVHLFISAESGTEDYFCLDWRDNVIFHRFKTEADNWRLYGPESASLLEDFIEAVDIVATTQMNINMFMSDVIAATESGADSVMAVASNYLQSKVDTIRGLANQIVTSGPGSALLTIASYLGTGLDKIRDMVSDTDDEHGFTLDDYQATPAYDILTGVWKIMPEVLSAVGTIALIVGGAVVKTIGAICMGVGYAVEAMRNLVDDKTSHSYGSGTNGLYANAIKIKVRVQSATYGYNKDQAVTVSTPWGLILMSAVERTGEPGNYSYWQPMLIYFSARPNNVTVFGKPWFFTRVVDERRTLVCTRQEYAERLKWASNDARSLATEQTAQSDDIWNAAAFIPQNIGRMAQFLAALALEHAYARQEEGYEYHNTYPILDEVHVGDFQSLVRAATETINTIGIFDDSNHILTGSGAFGYAYTKKHVDHDAAWNWFDEQNVFNYIEEYVRTSCSDAFDTEHMENRTFTNPFMLTWLQEFENMSTAMAGYDVPTWDAWDEIVRMLRAKANGVANLPLFSSSVDQSIVYYWDGRVSASDAPVIPTDNWLYPPLINRRSLVIAGAVVLGAIAIASVVLFFLKRSARRRQLGKAVRREKAALEAQEEYLKNPTKENLKKFFKAQRKYQRYAGKVGYASNSIGSFSTASSTDIAEMAAKVRSVAVSEDGGNAMLAGLYPILTGGAAPVDDEVKWPPIPILNQ